MEIQGKIMKLSPIFFLLLVLFITSCDDPSPNNVAPTLTLNGDNTHIIKVNGVFDDPGASANDVDDGDLSAAIVVEGAVDTSLVGAYSLIYSVSDRDGAFASIERVVIVIEELVLSTDTNINPTVGSVPSDDGLTLRSVGAVSYEDIQVDFVESELLVVSDDYGAVVALATRWSGEIIDTVEIDNADNVHTLRVDPTGVDLSIVEEYLTDLGAEGFGDMLFSSNAVRDLFAVSIQEMAETGMTITVNWLMESSSIGSGVSAEGPSADSSYTENAFLWPYLSLNSAQDMGVAAAWKLLDIEGVTATQDIMIIDGGFIDIGDFPEQTLAAGSGWNVENGSNCGGSSCPWHGTAVAHVAAGVPDNGIGIAGSAGPHARLELIQLGAFDVAGFARLLGLVLAAPLDGPPAVINISGGIEVPPVLNIGVNRLLDPLIGHAHDFGLLIVASAGNDGVNVDQRANWFGRDMPWERSTIIPCETRSVVCVGGLNFDSTSKHVNSNYGSDAETDSVDIYASYEYWIPDIRDDGVSLNTNKLGQGTSYSAPFVSGVIALMRSANVNLSAEEAVSCLMTSAHTHGLVHSAGGNQRRVDAFTAVNCALRGVRGRVSYPLLELQAPVAPLSALGQTSIELLATSLGSDGESPAIAWSSNLDGDLITTGSGYSGSYSSLSVGTHTVTARIVDVSGDTASESVELTIENNLPTVSILSPVANESYGEGQSIRLAATSYDVDARGRLDETQISWSIEGQSYTAAGHSAEIPGGLLTIGSYTVMVTADDGSSASQDSHVFSVSECSGECPTATIVLPGRAIEITTSQRDPDTGLVYADVTFSGLVTDAEDGTPNMSWSSVSSISSSVTNICTPFSIGGFTMTCDEFTQRLILPDDIDDPEGITYFVTLKATDSDGNTASDTISVTLKYGLI